MREILFRGKRINSMKAGEWTEGFFMEWLNPCKNRKEARIQTISEGGCIDLIHEVDPETVGQYTGLKDMNGKRIFEGDIVEGVCYNEDDGYGVVKWDDGAFIVSNNDWCGSFVENYYGEMFKIIGNIHDNPDRLHQRKEDA